jgi:hypothetical protein
MKEGYYQKKIAEFSEKLQDFNHRLKMAETEFERYQIDLGNFKDLLKKLKNIEKFQQLGLEEFTREIKDIIDIEILSLKNNAEKTIEKVIDQKSLMMNKVYHRLEHDEKQFQTSFQEIGSLREELLYFKEFQRLLILKLINKRILNHREFTEIEHRAKKRVKEMD